MAKDKMSFIMYADQSYIFEKLTDAKAGRLIKLIFDYVNDKNPETMDILLQVAFEPIKQQLKRDLKDWEAEKRRLQENGKKGGIKSGESRRSRSQRSPTSKNEASEAVNVNVTVTDNVNVSERDSTTPQVLYKIEECLLIALRDDRWTKANKVAEDELNDFNSMLEKVGVYQKNPMDYKSHFSRWKAKGKKQETISQKTTMVM